MAANGITTFESGISLLIQIVVTQYFGVRCRVSDNSLCLPAADADCAGGGGDEEKRSLMERRS